MPVDENEVRKFYRFHVFYYSLDNKQEGNPLISSNLMRNIDYNKVY